MNGRTNIVTTNVDLIGSDIPLEPIADLTCNGRDQSVELTWTDPVDKYTAPGDELVIQWDHTVIIRKQGSAPVSPTDGTVVISSSTRDQYKHIAYVDTGLTNDVEYFYAAYSVSTVGSVSEMCVVSVIPRMGFVYFGDTSDGTIALPNRNHLLSTPGKMRESTFDGYFLIHNGDSLNGYDSDLQFNILADNSSNMTSYFGASVGDTKHVLFETTRSLGKDGTDSFDNDFVFTLLKYGRSRGVYAGKNTSYFIFAGGDGWGENPDAGYGNPWVYDRETLVATVLSVGNVTMNAYPSGYSSSANAGEYYICAYRLGDPWDGGSYAFSDDLTITELSNVSETNVYFPGSLGVSIGNHAVFFGNRIECPAFDEDLVYSADIGSHLPYVSTAYYHDAIRVGAFAVIANSGDGKTYHYDFSVMDNDFIITDRGITKTKYRRYGTLMGTIGNKLIITSYRSDQLSDSEEMTNNSYSSEVYTF